MKGDSRSQMTLLRLAEQIGQFEEAPGNLQRIERVIVQWQAPDDDRKNGAMLPANSAISRED